MTSTQYTKRAGTSGIRGQLYETKLISLINFRAEHNADIEEFALATNMDKIGIFDDICLRFKVKTIDEPFAVFIQAKHRENDTLLKNDWATYFDSYSKIKQAFQPSNDDLIFKGEYDKIQCFFVIYTTARGDCHYRPFKNSFASILNDTIGTAQCGQQIVVKNQDEECLHKVIIKEQIKQLAKPIAKLLFNEIADFSIFMSDELVSIYHVILAEKFCNVSDMKNEGHRLAYVRQDFFDTDDEYLTTFKSSLYKEIIGKRKVEESEIKTLVNRFFDQPSNITILSKLIGCVITHKNDMFEFINNKIINQDQKQKLSKIRVPAGILENAIEIAGRETLISKRNFKVSAAFGNKDLIVRKDERLTYLVSRIIDLIDKSNHNNVITIDETIDKGFQKLNGGLAGAVGNLLVHDETSKMLKFNENLQELGNVAKRLLQKLQSENIDLHKYRLDVKIKIFPRLTFECGDHDKNMVRDFFNRLLFYTNQADENDTGKIVKEEIEKHQSDQVSKNSFLSHLIFLKYHDAIQSWWMLPHKASYLTENSKIFVNAMKTVVSEPPMTVMTTMYDIKAKEADVTFNDNVIGSLNISDQPENIVITDSILLSLYKVKQVLQGKDHEVLDIDYSLNLPPSEFETLFNELQGTNKNKTIIIVINRTLNICKELHEKVSQIAKETKNRHTIIITDNTRTLEMVKEIFSKELNVVNDDKTSLMDLSEDTQHSVLQKKINFQGQEIKLKVIIDEISRLFVKGEVLSRLIHNEAILLGELIDNSNYKNIKDMSIYIGRRVCRNKKRNVPVMRIQASDDTLIRLKLLQHETCSTLINKYDETQKESLHIDTLHDIDDNVVVLTTAAVMGKSILFSHLIQQTKKVDETLWIIRTNLRQQTGQFLRWQKDRIAVDISKCLEFMCLVILGDKRHDVTFNLRELDNELYLDSCTGNELLLFELKMFIHFYNRKKLIFLFEEFDEICSKYVNEALMLLKTLKNDPKYIKHKMWITSRPYENIKAILEQEFDVSYDLEKFSWIETNTFLFMFWIRNGILVTDENQRENIYDFIDNMSQSPDFNILLNEDDLLELGLVTYLPVFINFICYLKIELKSAPPRIMDALSGLYDKYSTRFTLLILANSFLEDIRTTRLYLRINTFMFQEFYLASKLKVIWFDDKNQIDVKKPDNSMLHELERKRILEMYKKLGAYVVFQKDIMSFFKTC